MVDMQANTPEWYPTGVGLNAGKLEFTIADFSQQSINQSFFEPLSFAKSSARKIAFPALPGDDSSLRKPDALIFHGSRCGSTLVSQMLGSLPGTVSLSEPAIFDQLVSLRSSGDISDKVCAEAMRYVANEFTQHRLDRNGRFFLKVDSWHVSHFEAYTSAFGKLPAIYMYREPARVLLSHKRERGRQMVTKLMPGHLRGLDLPPITSGDDFDTVADMVLSHFYQTAVLLAKNGSIHLVNYSDLPAWTWETLPPLLGWNLGENGVALMRERTKTDSKRKGDPFQDFIKHPESAEPAMVPVEPGQALKQAYETLETLRLEQRLGASAG